MANRSHRWGDLRDDVPRYVRAGCSRCTRDSPEVSYTVVSFNAIIDVSIGIQQNVIKSTHGSCMMADGLNVDVDNSRRRRRKSYASSSPTKFVRIINDVSFYLILPPPSSPYFKIKIESHPASSSIISYSIPVLLLFLFLLLIHVVVPWVCVMSSSSSSCSSFNSLCA